MEAGRQERSIAKMDGHSHEVYGQSRVWNNRVELVVLMDYIMTRLHQHEV
jgi:hypothetical protein